jgi:hypothetical protein
VCTYPGVVFDLPRSLRLAAWGTAVLRDGADPAVAVAAVTGEDEPHTVSLPEAAGPVGLAALLDRLGIEGALGLRVVLPAPGDLLGLPGPAGVNAAALDVGECVLAEPGPRGPWWAAVPTVTKFGSDYEPGTMVAWTVYPVASHRGDELPALADAEREMAMALRAATDRLQALDVAAWRPDAAQRLTAVRASSLTRGILPDSTPPRCLRVLASAARLRAIVGLAVEDDGAAINGYEALHRIDVLRRLDATCRRAMAAAVNGILEPAR